MNNGMDCFIWQSVVDFRACKRSSISTMDFPHSSPSHLVAALFRIATTSRPILNGKRNTALEDSHTHSPQKPWRTVQDAMPVSDFVPLLHWNANIHPSPSAANPIYVYDIYDRH